MNLMTVIMTLMRIKRNSHIKNHKFGDLINLKITKKLPSISQVIHTLKLATQYPVVTDVA